MTAIRRIAARISAIGLRGRILAITMGGFVLGVVVLESWTIAALHARERATIERQLDRNLDLLSATLADHGQGFRLEADNRLFLGQRALNGFNDVPDRVTRFGSGVATIFAGETRIATNVQRPDGTRAVGTVLGPGPALDAVRRGETFRGEAIILGRPHLTVYQPVRDAAGRQVGILFVGVDLATADAVVQAETRGTVIAVGVVLLVAGLGLWWLLTIALRPLGGLTVALRAIGAGQLATDVPCTARGDELGDIGRAVAGLRDAAAEAQASRALAETARAEAQAARSAARIATAGELESSVGGIAAELGAAAEALRVAADAVGDAGDRTATRAEASAGRVHQATGNVQALAAAAEELAASVAEITRQVGLSARTAEEAVEAARASDSTVTGLSEAASRIGDVVRLISDIAAQTNLLALNATIEAARAGDAGKGFAVVAGEVKSLAAQTARATGEISAQIGAMRSATDQAVGTVRGIASAVGRMEEVTTAIAAAVEQQSAATREIARNAAEAAAGTDEAAQDIARLSQDVASGAAAMTSLRGAGARVGRQGDVLRREVAGFAERLRAG